MIVGYYSEYHMEIFGELFNRQEKYIQRIMEGKIIRISLFNRSIRSDY